MTAPLSIQLYSLREEAQRDFPAVLARLGQAGYAGVEPAGFHALSPFDFRSRVEEAGMRVSSSHIALPTADNAAQILDPQQEIGCEDVVVAFFPPDQFQDAAAVDRVAEQLNEAHRHVSARSMRLGYHNHWWEFESQIGGESAHARLFRQLHDEVFAELDTYWARVGGADPVDLVASLGERARLLHLKDGPADGPKSPMVAVGDGVIDVAGIVGASKAAWHVVELDHCATDMFEAVEKSRRNLVERGLSEQAR